MKNKKVKKAVFPVAGFGSRFLPATKALPKELLPIIDKPLIQYAAEEAMQAGIDTLIFITGRHKRAIEDHFDRSPELEDSLEKKGRTEDAKMIKEIIPRGVNCIFIRQHTQLGLGHAILCSEKVVGKEPFAILLADDFLDDGKQSLISKLVKDYNSTGVPQLGAMEVEEKEVSNYGIIVPGKKPYAVKGLKEKPKVSQAPSNLASIGRYVLSHKIFEILRKQDAGFGGEIQLADAIDKYSVSNAIEYKMIEGLRFDCGSVSGYVEAIMHMSKKRKMLTARKGR